MTTLAELADAVEPADLDAAETFRARHTEATRGTLRDIAAWMTAVQASTSPHVAERVRVVRFGYAVDAGPPRAGDGDVRNVPTPNGDLAAAIDLGVHVADDEIDRGADLIVAVVARSGVTAEVLTAALTNAEPVRVLPRGTALSPGEWMARAELVRDQRRKAIAARDSVDELLDVVGDRSVAAASAFLLRAAARRTAVLLDGFGALAAALVAFEVQTRSARWYRVADSSGSSGEDLAIRRLGQRALLELGIELEDGTAGLLAATVVRFAIETSDTAAI